MSAEPIRDRLRRLRRETAPRSGNPNRDDACDDDGATVHERSADAPATVMPPAPDSDRSSPSVRERLSRRRPPSASQNSLAPAARPGGTCGRPARLVDRDGPDGKVSARVSVYDSVHRHGHFSLDEAAGADADVLALVARDSSLADVDFTRAVYLDTETTGLSGGAGTYVFVVGLGSFEAGRFELWQGFLEHPSLERALLAEAARRIASASAIVSFFGKAFDRHRLEDKMRLHGIAPPFADVRHLDLFHPLQRLYRGALEDTRLRTLEAALCGVERADDLSGAFAPAAWFDYLAGRAHALEGVLTHNEHDVLSLVTLLAHLGRSTAEQRVGGEPIGGPETARARGLARVFGQEGRHAEAAVWFERALARTIPGPHTHGAARRMRLCQAESWARSGAHERALEALRTLCDETEDECTAESLLALARLSERILHDPGAALAACRRARGVVERHATGARYARLARECRARLDRLERASRAH